MVWGAKATRPRPFFMPLFTGVRGSMEFSEVAPPAQLCYLVCKRFGEEREEGGEKACVEWRLCSWRWL